jgi:hypothetical protein
VEQINDTHSIPQNAGKKVASKQDQNPSSSLLLGEAPGAPLGMMTTTIGSRDEVAWEILRSQETTFRLGGLFWKTFFIRILVPARCEEFFIKSLDGMEQAHMS